MSGGGENRSEGHAVRLNRKTNRFTGMPARTGENQKLDLVFYEGLHPVHGPTARRPTNRNTLVPGRVRVYGFSVADSFSPYFPVGRQTARLGVDKRARASPACPRTPVFRPVSSARTFPFVERPVGLAVGLYQQLGGPFRFEIVAGKVVFRRLLISLKRCTATSETRRVRV